jgi:hypothetical protein
MSAHYLDRLWERIVQDRLKNRGVLGFLLGLCVFAFAAGLQVTTATAQDAGASTETAEPQKPAPRATASKPASARKSAQRGGGRYYVEFRSRHALSYGHTFVMFGRLNARGEIATREVAGLHPKGEGPELWTVGHLVFVPAETGPSDGDLEDEYMSARHRIELSEAEYNRLLAHIRHKQANSPLWHAALYNCNLWTGEIAQYMGLRTPHHWLRPQEYVEGIRDLNKDRQQAAAMPARAAAPADAYSSSAAVYTSDDRYPTR